MDELAARRRQRAKKRLPPVETMVEMFESERMARFRVPDDRELLVEARRRIRKAAKDFGRPVETHYVKSTGILFGVVPLTPQETEEEAGRLKRPLRRIR